MKPPKNFYSNLDRRKQGLPEVPEASAADAGKIIKVGETGAYELGDDEIPTPTVADAGKVLTVDNAGALKFANVPYIATIVDSTVSEIAKVVDIINNGGYVIFRWGTRFYEIQKLTSSTITASTFDLLKSGTDFYLETLFAEINTTTGNVTSYDKYVKLQ